MIWGMKVQESLLHSATSLSVSAGLQYRLNPEEVDSQVSEGVDALATWGQAGKEQTLPPSMSLNRLPAEGVA